MEFTITTEFNMGDRVITPDDPEEIGTVTFVTFDDMTGEGDEKYKVEYTVTWTSTYRGKAIETKHAANEIEKVK